MESMCIAHAFFFVLTRSALGMTNLGILHTDILKSITNIFPFPTKMNWRILVLLCSLLLKTLTIKYKVPDVLKWYS